MTTGEGQRQFNRRPIGLRKCNKKKCVKFTRKYVDVMSRDSSVGIATRYGLDDPRFSSLQGPKIFLFSTASRPGLGFTQPSI
jgi:hypothetical protein